jgi:O-antigen/teichoic acid export membrane protein
MVRRLRTLLYILLRQSEKYTKTDMVYLASGGFWSLVGQVVSSITVLGVSVLLARYLTQDGYGQYKYVLSLVALLSTLSLSGLTGSVLQSTARGFDGALPDGFKINLRWSILMFVGALAIGGYYLLHGNFLLGVGMLVGGCTAPFIAGAGLYSVFLAAKKDFARQTIYMIFGVMLLPSAALIAAAVLTRDPLVVVLAYFISNALGALYFYYRTLAVYRAERGQRDPGMLTYTKHLSFMGILGGLASNLDQILLFQFVGPAQLAIYNFATGIPDQLKGPLKNLDSMLQARFANHLSGPIRDNMRNKSLLLLGFGIVCAAVYIPLAPYIFKILFPRYMEAVPYSQVYVLYLLTLPFIPSASYLAAKRLIKEQYIGSILNHTFKICFTFIGVAMWGLWGLIGAVIASRFAGGLASYVLYYIASKRDEKI